MNSLRSILHPLKLLCGAAYPGRGCIGTGCISPGANFLRPFLQRVGRLLALTTVCQSSYSAEMSLPV
jgi:hypothetical protein